MRIGINPNTAKHLLLEAAGLSSRTFPEQFQYGFLLKNENGEVIKKKISGENQFLMDELAPGNYAAEVTVYNQDLLASQPLKFNFSVSPAPFPKTSAALGVLLAVALIASFGQSSSVEKSLKQTAN